MGEVREVECLSARLQWLRNNVRASEPHGHLLGS